MRALLQDISISEEKPGFGLSIAPVYLYSSALHPGASLEAVVGKGVVPGCCPEHGQALFYCYGNNQACFRHAVRCDALQEMVSKYDLQ